MVARGAKHEKPAEPGPLEEAWRIFDARHLPYRLLMLGKLLDRLSAQHVRELADLSLAEWRVLAHIAVMGSKRASEVSAAALVDRAEVSRAVRALEAGGMLQRRDNPRHRKSNLLALTPHGQNIYDRIHAQRSSFFNALTADIDDAELDQLDSLLLRMARRVDQFAQEGLGANDLTPADEPAARSR